MHIRITNFTYEMSCESRNTLQMWHYVYASDITKMQTRLCFSWNSGSSTERKLSRSADLGGAVASVFANVHYDGDNETHQSLRRGVRNIRRSATIDCPLISAPIKLSHSHDSPLAGSAEARIIRRNRHGPASLSLPPVVNAISIRHLANVAGHLPSRDPSILLSMTANSLPTDFDTRSLQSARLLIDSTQISVTTGPSDLNQNNCVAVIVILYFADYHASESQKLFRIACLANILILILCIDTKGDMHCNHSDVVLLKLA